MVHQDGQLHVDRRRDRRPTGGDAGRGDHHSDEDGVFGLRTPTGVTTNRCGYGLDARRFGGPSHWLLVRRRRGRLGGPRIRRDDLRGQVLQPGRFRVPSVGLREGTDRTAHRTRRPWDGTVHRLLVVHYEQRLGLTIL